MKKKKPQFSSMDQNESAVFNATIGSKNSVAISGSASVDIATTGS